AEHHEPIQAAPAWEPKAEKPKGGVESIEDFLADSLIQILYLESDTIDRQQSFIDLGLDSVLAVEWVQTIRAKYGVKIPATKVYDYSTVEALAAYLASQSEGDDADPTPPVTLSLDEILVAVSTGRMNVAEAEVLLDALDLNALVEQEGGAS
ncbi:MAG: acyl carrier protein, partial [Rhodobacteraceae bacterium]|nr:acyl carrier protein [Paracoccaceae bacterium]